MDEQDVTTPMPDEIRLRALMAGYQAGDLASFDSLYADLVRPVTGFMRRHASDPQQVQDLVQDTFLQIHRARHTYDPAYPVMPWTMAIARHVWLMHCRRLRRRPQATGSVEGLALATRGSAEAYPEQADVRAALASLAPERRKPLVWHHVFGLSFREIARRLRIREDAAKLRSSRAMAQLRKTLGGRPPLKQDAND